ncbi:unnamed protein product [Durusdinium trenchii]|uniref:Uncharacterized protein n=1 Tax=Durusdinium trenchii TaxID=1381693 RepID=A0ABP0MJP1_9DINO
MSWRKGQKQPWTEPTWQEEKWASDGWTRKNRKKEPKERPVLYGFDGKPVHRDGGSGRPSPQSASKQELSVAEENSKLKATIRFLAQKVAATEEALRAGYGQMESYMCQMEARNQQMAEQMQTMMETFQSMVLMKSPSRWSPQHPVAPMAVRADSKGKSRSRSPIRVKTEEMEEEISSAEIKARLSMVPEAVQMCALQRMQDDPSQFKTGPQVEELIARALEEFKEAQSKPIAAMVPDAATSQALKPFGKSALPKETERATPYPNGLPVITTPKRSEPRLNGMS